MQQSVVVLGEVEARELTARIKRVGGHFGALLVEAHDGEAWRALGYGSWGEYVAAEFAFSRQRSYQLLAVGRVEQATGERVPYRLAEQVVKHAGQVTDITSDPFQSPAYLSALAEQRGKVSPAPSLETVEVEVRRFGVPVAKPKGKRGGYLAPVDRWRQWADALEEAGEAKGGESLADPEALRVLGRIARAVMVLMR